MEPVQLLRARDAAIRAWLAIREVAGNGTDLAVAAPVN
jgi:hypothetical protein